MKITEYPSITEFTEDQVLLVDGTGGTKKVLVKDAILAALHMTSAHNHRTIFRGKNLGTSLTSAQKGAIQAGTFDDMWLGDYWEINGVKWRIADFDYWYNTGDTKFLNHHLVLIPDTVLYDTQMSSTATTSNGYGGSLMRSSGLTQAKSTVQSAFGSALLTHKEYLTSTVAGGIPTACTWYDATVEIPSEIMMYGCSIYGVASNGTTVPSVATNCKTQLALFRVAPEFISIGDIYWLRDVVSATQFARVYSSGIAQVYEANTNVGVRPVFAIG